MASLIMNSVLEAIKCSAILFTKDETGKENKYLGKVIRLVGKGVRTWF